MYLLILHIRLTFFAPSLTLHNVKIYSAKPNKQSNRHTMDTKRKTFFFSSSTSFMVLPLMISFSIQPSIQNSSLWTLFNTFRCVSNNNVQHRKSLHPLRKTTVSGQTLTTLWDAIDARRCFFQYGYGVLMCSIGSNHIYPKS